jgi:hypothetical protein
MAQLYFFRFFFITGLATDFRVVIKYCYGNFKQIFKQQFCCNNEVPMLKVKFRPPFCQKCLIFEKNRQKQ